MANLYKGFDPDGLPSYPAAAGSWISFVTLLAASSLNKNFGRCLALPGTLFP